MAMTQQQALAIQLQRTNYDPFLLGIINNNTKESVAIYTDVYGEDALINLKAELQTLKKHRNFYTITNNNERYFIAVKNEYDAIVWGENHLDCSYEIVIREGYYKE